MLRPKPAICLLAISLAATISFTTAVNAQPAQRSPVTATHLSQADQQLQTFYAQEWERRLTENPESATFQGDTRFDDRWTDMSLEAIARREQSDREAYAHLQKIDRSTLSADWQLNYDILEWQLRHAVERQKFKEYVMPIDQKNGVQTLDNIAEILPFKTVKQYQDWNTRLAAIPVLIDQTIVLMEEGIKAGKTPPKVLLERVPAQIQAQLVKDPTQSKFYTPYKKLPADIPAEQKAQLQQQAQKTIQHEVIPAYQKLLIFFNDHYLPKANTSIAAIDMPDGKQYYDFLAGYFTTTDLTADQIHEIGLKEVKRIRHEMEAIKSEVGFKGSLAEFFEYLRTDTKFFYKTPEELIAAYRDVSKRIDPELVKVFRVIPRLPYGVRAIPDNIAPDTTTAYYMPGAADGTRAGFYYVNLYKPEVRPKWEMIALSLHEAVPGHHFQFARGLELPNAPDIRRTAYFVAYSEGWGLYAERLGYDMGLYDDPYDRMGQLAYDMWRAVRLVVDTGMHTKGWSRDKAIAFFMDNSPKTRQDVVNEIDRYISWPGQALAYKIGQLKISELREKSKKELGTRFDLRQFNDAVLETGSVPLDVLEKHIDSWIARQKSNASTTTSP